TPEQQQAAASKAVSDNNSAVTNQVNQINSALGTAAGDIGKVASGLNPKFTGMKAPDGSTPGQAPPPPGITTPSGTAPGGGGDSSSGGGGGGGGHHGGGGGGGGFGGGGSG